MNWRRRGNWWKNVTKGTASLFPKHRYAKNTKDTTPHPCLPKAPPDKHIEHVLILYGGCSCNTLLQHIQPKAVTDFLVKHPFRGHAKTWLAATAVPNQSTAQQTFSQLIVGWVERSTDRTGRAIVLEINFGDSLVRQNYRGQNYRLKSLSHSLCPVTWSIRLSWSLGFAFGSTQPTRATAVPHSITGTADLFPVISSSSMAWNSSSNRAASCSQRLRFWCHQAGTITADEIKSCSLSDG